MDGSDDGPSCRRQLFQRENERVGRGTVQAACRFIQKEYRRFCYKLNPDWLKKKWIQSKKNLFGGGEER